MESPFEFEAATKRYGARTALHETNIRIEPSERVAVLGRNGAGKTTLLRLALGLCRPTSGTCRSFGWPAGHRWALCRLGYTSQSNSVPGRLRVRELIRFVCDSKAAGDPSDLIDAFDLGSLLHMQAGALSLGQTRRLMLLFAFVGQPEVVVLDEPTVSLDASSRLAAWEHIRQFCDDGGTLVLASHDFREVATLVDRVLVLVDGTVRVDSDVADLARESGVTALEVPSAIDVAVTAMSHVIHRADRTILITRRPDHVISAILPEVGAGSVIRRPPTVEEVCLALGGGGRD